jgi:hypothetical protein
VKGSLAGKSAHDLAAATGRSYGESQPFCYQTRVFWDLTEGAELLGCGLAELCRCAALFRSKLAAVSIRWEMPQHMVHAKATSGVDTIFRHL